MSVVYWLLALLICAAGGAAAGFALRSEGMLTLGNIVLVAADVICTGLLIYALIRWREVAWVRAVGPIAATTLVLGYTAIGLYLSGSNFWALAVAGTLAMALAFSGGLLVLRHLLSYGSGLTAVARNLVDEAIRMKVGLIFIALLLLMLPIIPLTFDPEEMLKYRVQTFLTWSLSVTSGLLGLMTVFLACGTVCRDIKQRHVFMSMVKPLRSFEYIAGKWLGIMALNLLLVAVAGGGIYGFARILQQMPAKDQLDRLAVDEQILVARASVMPSLPPGAFAEEFERRVEQIRQERATSFGEGSVTSADRAEIRNQLRQAWHVLDPRETETYHFTGLLPAKRLAQEGVQQSVQLRLEPETSSATADGRVGMQMRVAGRPFPVPRLATSAVHVLDIPASAIDNEGRLVIQLRNANVDVRGRPTSIRFTPDEDLELFYRVGGFEGNLTRGLFIVWLRLGFVAMMGIAAGTFLGFPVACLLTMFVYLVAVAHGFQAQSNEYFVALAPGNLPAFERLMWYPTTIFSHLYEGKPWEAAKIVIRLLGWAFLSMVPDFSDFDAILFVGEGKRVPWQMIRDAIVMVAGVSTGVLLLGAWFIFSRKELAKITV